MMQYDGLRAALKDALAASKREVQSRGHEWDVADALDAITPLVWEATDRGR